MDDVIEFFGLLVLVVALLAGGAFAGGAALMFAVGAVHVWIPAVPTIGYVEATVIVAAAYLLGAIPGTAAARSKSS